MRMKIKSSTLGIECFKPELSPPSFDNIPGHEAMGSVQNSSIICQSYNKTEDGHADFTADARPLFPIIEVSHPQGNYQYSQGTCQFSQRPTQPLNEDCSVVVCMPKNIAEERCKGTIVVFPN